MPAAGRLLAMIVFLLSELHASCLARGTHGIRDMSEEMNAHIVGLTVTFAILSFLGWFMHNSNVSQHRKHFDVRMGIKPHTLLEHVYRSVHR